jgi:hypothetical protein
MNKSKQTSANTKQTSADTKQTSANTKQNYTHQNTSDCCNFDSEHQKYMYSFISRMDEEYDFY